jgi:hypothetical protein
MLNQILQEIKTSKGPMSLPALSHKLGIERGALEGMLMYWVRKGRLKEDNTQASVVCKSGSCGSSCTGIENCPFIAQMPKSYSLRSKDKNNVMK